LGEIENALMAHHVVRDAVTRITRLPNGQNGIVAYVVVESQPASAESLRTFLSTRLPSYMIPASFVWMESLPKTVHGKIDLKRLPPPNALDHSEKRKVLPRTVTETEIAALWKSLLKVESVSVEDDFFELGGDSLSATRFATSVRKQFGVELPLSRMMSAPTIQALSTFIETEHRNASKLPDGMIALRLASQRGALPPLFFTPPASGSPACYTVLAGALAGDRTVYGFEASGLTSGKPSASVTSQARQYVAALQSVYPEGPCYIAGWSLGGPAAFEMACQLRDAGREVVYLALIDAGLPEDGRLPGRASMMVPLWWAISYPFVERIPLNYQTVRMLSRWVGILLPESLSHIWRRGWQAGTRFAAELAKSGWRSLRVFLANIRAFRGYRPRAYDGEITLFRTAQGGTLDNGKDVLFNNLRQWCRDVQVHEAPGSHMTLMLDPKLCSAFASSFEATLEIELAQAKLESSVSGTQNRRAL
jgi:thioesterase domain-containing protein/acyl carrier protein